MDFVITWVDGQDKKWLEEKSRFVAGFGQDDIPARYRDWGLLRYWFRGVEKFAPWVRKIHFVTCGHLPDWLDTDSPKLNIVRHSDFIPEEYLPTFNSHTIELNLHRIPGLCDEFVYFNDDMFLTASVNEEYFFKGGLPCDEFILDAVYFSPDSAGAYNGNCLELINKNFSLKKMRKNYRFMQIYNPSYGLKNLYRTAVLIRWPWYTGFHYNHLPTSLLKSTMETVWKLEHDTLDATCRDRFRSKRNVSPWLFKYWQLASGNFHPRSPHDGKVFHIKHSLPKSLCEAVTTGQYKMICINDTAKTANLDRHKEMLGNAFLARLPDKSSYEKTTAHGSTKGLQ